MSAAPNPVHAPVQKPEIVTAPPVPVRPKTGGPFKWLALLIAIIVAAVAIYLVRNQQQQSAARTAAVTSARTAAVTTGPLERWTRISGATAAIDFANITAPIQRGPESNREMILIELAKSGSWVKKGTLVAQIDAQSVTDHLDDLADTIETAEADIRKRKAEQSIEWENLQQSLRVAQAEAGKARLDYSAAEVRTDVERQLLKLTLDETEARYKQLQGDLKNKQLSQAADLRLLEITMERHTRHRDRHARDLKLFSVYAPMDGLVVMSQIFRGGEFAQVQQGDRVFPGQGFMKIVNTNKMRVEGTINQAESSQVRVGQKARVRLDAFPGLEFKGEVDGIAALAAGGFRQGYYIRNVPIRIRIDGNDPRLIPDLSASVEIILDRAEHGTIAPLAGLEERDGKTFAQVKNNDRFERREVQVGLSNGTHALILAGLEPGEQIRVN
jgi:multidrug resistance efflux pump